MSKISDLKDYKKISISISLVDSEEIQSLNKEYLNRDYPTDVLSFNIDERMNQDTYYLGDVVINRDVAAKQAAKYSNDVEHEISELAAHGILHLLGIHHKGDDHSDEIKDEMKGSET